MYFQQQNEILQVKLGISTKFHLQNIIQSHIFNILSVPGFVTHWGLHCQVIIYFAACYRQIYLQSCHSISVVFITVHTV